MCFMDSFYPATKLVKLIHRFSWNWIAKIKFNRLIDDIQIQEFFRYRYGNHIGKLSENIRTLVVRDNDFLQSMFFYYTHQFLKLLFCQYARNSEILKVAYALLYFYVLAHHI